MRHAIAISMGLVVPLAACGSVGGTTPASRRSPTVNAMSDDYRVGWTVVAVGDQPLIGASDAFITRLDRAGNEAWTRLLGGPDMNTEATDAVVDADGNLYVIGKTSGWLEGTRRIGLGDAFLAKYDRAGTRSWVREIGADGATIVLTDVARDPDGGVFVAGWIDVTGRDAKHVILQNYDADGTKVWRRGWPLGVGTLDAQIESDPARTALLVHGCREYDEETDEGTEWFTECIDLEIAFRPDGHADLARYRSHSSDPFVALPALAPAPPMPDEVAIRADRAFADNLLLALLVGMSADARDRVVAIEAARPQGITPVTVLACLTMTRVVIDNHEEVIKMLEGTIARRGLSMVEGPDVPLTQTQISWLSRSIQLVNRGEYDLWMESVCDGLAARASSLPGFDYRANKTRMLWSDAPAGGATRI